jgi:Protein of unknown function (DUF938)
LTLGNTDARRHSPAAERNAAHILAELKRLLPPSGLLLEIASGTGQHAAFCGASLPDWTWLPSDAEAEALPSIRAWCAGLPNVREPIQLDVLRSQWPDVPAQIDAIYCANMIHIAPWACCVGLFEVAARHLTPQGLLITYGPYLEDEVPTAPSNMAFDGRLRSEDAAWGLRRREDVEQVAAQAGLSLRSRIEMPANNLMLIWERSSNS